MKKIIALCFGLLAWMSGFTQVLQDGPYVLYRSDSILVKSVQQGRPEMDAFPVKANEHISVPVNFLGHTDWNFRVNLKAELHAEPSEFKQPEKLFFVSDIEGEFEGFRKLLISAKIIDEKYYWTFGKGHLVVCGDLFDRGSFVPEFMWLLYKLEQEAEKKGGYVHTIFGNHDIMNMSGDVRYVQPKYFESARLLGLDYMQLYGEKTELGRWLRSKNVIEKIGSNLCLHAGISPAINKLSMTLEEINSKCRPYYAVKTSLIPEESKVFFGADSPFWYRGYFLSPIATEMEVDETLKLYGAEKIVVGHTITDDNIGMRYHGKVLALDVDRHQGRQEAARYQNGSWSKIDEDGQASELVNR